jgi:hypothetical protein
MKHSAQELAAIAYAYFPRASPGQEANYEAPIEAAKRQEAHARASAQYGTWRELCERLEKRFPPSQFPGVSVQNLSLFLQSPTIEVTDLAYCAHLHLATRDAAERDHLLTFRVSFVAPYYSIQSRSIVWTTQYFARLGAGPPRRGDVQSTGTYDLSADEAPFAQVIEEEIDRAFPEHERMSPDVGTLILPDILAGGRMPGEATIFDCLFSTTW